MLVCYKGTPAEVVFAILEEEMETLSTWELVEMLEIIQEELEERAGEGEPECL